MPFEQILTLDNALLVIMIYFMTLWHLRTKARDTAFFETMRSMMQLITECQKGLVTERSPKRHQEDT